MARDNNNTFIRLSEFIDLTGGLRRSQEYFTCTTQTSILVWQTGQRPGLSAGWYHTTPVTLHCTLLEISNQVGEFETIVDITSNLTVFSLLVAFIFYISMYELL